MKEDWSNTYHYNDDFDFDDIDVEFALLETPTSPADHAGVEKHYVGEYCGDMQMQTSLNKPADIEHSCPQSTKVAQKRKKIDMKTPNKSLSTTPKSVEERTKLSYDQESGGNDSPTGSVQKPKTDQLNHKQNMAVPHEEPDKEIETDIQRMVREMQSSFNQTPGDTTIMSKKKSRSENSQFFSRFVIT